MHVAVVEALKATPTPLVVLDPSGQLQQWAAWVEEAGQPRQHACDARLQAAQAEEKYGRT